MKKLRFWTGLIEVVSFFVLVCLIILFSAAYTRVKARTGGWLIGVFWLGIAAYGVLFFFKRFPRLIRYPVPLTPENVDFQARLARLFLSIMTFLSMCILAIVELNLYWSAVGKDVSGFGVVIAILALLCILSIVLYNGIARRHS